MVFITNYAPQVIFVQNRYPKVVNEILQSLQWQVIDGDETVSGLPDVGLCQSLEISDARGDGNWRTVDDAKALFGKFHSIDM